LKLVLIISGLTTGGAETMLLKLLERIDRRTFSPHVISLRTLGDVGPRISALGIPVEALEMAGPSSPLAFLRLVARLRVIRPDVVHTWMYHADLLGGIAARLAGVRAIGWAIHNSNLDRDKTKRTTRRVVLLCAHLSRWLPIRILSCSEVARQVHVALGYADWKMVVIPNGFDVATFRPDESARRAVRAELGLHPEAPLVGLVGRYNPQKNHLGFIEAAGLLRQRWPGAHFVMAGVNVDAGNEALTSAARSAGIADAIHMLGLRQDVPRLMASLDVLVSSSSYG
jgi:glycosyltransferase involved in cell wall biosynthesis